MTRVKRCCGKSTPSVACAALPGHECISTASILGRILQSLFITDSGQEGRLQIYVDDPLLALKGTASRRKLLAVRYIAVATVLGIKLAFPKAKFGMEAGCRPKKGGHKGPMFLFTKTH